MSHNPNTRGDAQPADTAPDTDSEFVDPDDLKVSRDSDGERVAQVTEAGRFGKIKVLPMTYGDVEQYLGDGTTAEVEAEMLAQLFREFILKPDFGHLTADDIADWKPLAPRDLMLALFDVSGIDADVAMQEDGAAQVEVAGN